MFPLLQPGLNRTSLHDDRLGQTLDALCAAHLNRVCGAIARNALEVYALSTPWLPRTPRRSPSTEPMKRTPARSKDLSRLVLPRDTAKMGLRISRRDA